MAFWTEFRQWLQRELTLDAEWTIDSGHTMIWWGWHFPQRVEYLHEPEDQLRYITGRVRISTMIGQVTPDAQLQVAAILTAWNEDATGAIGIMDPDTGEVLLGMVIPVTETNLPLVTRLAVGTLPRQSAYATALARMLQREGLLDTGQVTLSPQPHPHFGVRKHPDELVALYIDGVHDGFSLAGYDTPEVHRQLAGQLQSALPLEPGFTDVEQGIRTFQLVEDNQQFVAYRFGDQPPGGLITTGPVLMVRASSPDAAVIVTGDDPIAAQTMFLTHANWHTWNEHRLPMLGAWLPGVPLSDDYVLTQVVSCIPPATLPETPNLTTLDRGSILQNLLVYVFHQAKAGGPLTFRVYE